MNMNQTDRDILRDLAHRVAGAAGDPAQDQRRRLWTEHNSLRPARPMVLVFPEGAWRELIPAESLQCEDPTARGMEHALRMRLYTWEHFTDDTVVEASWVVPKRVRDAGWGVPFEWTESPGAHGAGTYKPTINTASDIDRLQAPEVVYDEAASQAAFEQAEGIFGDILEVQLRGIQHVSFHLMALACRLHGLEETMRDMCMDPPFVHALMARLAEGHHGIVDAWEALNLLDVNNDNTYHSSGGNSFTDELPLPDCDPARVRTRDMWASAESQELAQVSPAMHAEFSLQYEIPLLDRFGLNGYGCCEDLTGKLDDVLRIPRIRRISISPWADVERCARQLEGQAIFSWKPHPAHLVGGFDEAAVENYLRHTVRVAREHGCFLEMILKDTHTCEHHPERFDQWTQVARRVVEEED